MEGDGDEEEEKKSEDDDDELLQVVPIDQEMELNDDGLSMRTESLVAPAEIEEYNQEKQ